MPALWPQQNLQSRIQKCLLILFLLHVGLLFVFPAPCLAVGAVPEEQHDEGYQEQAVGYCDGGHNGDKGLREVVVFQDDPRIDPAVVTGEGLAPLGQVFVLVGKHRARDFRRISAAFNVDQEWRVPHGLVLELVVSRQVDPLRLGYHVDSCAILPRPPAVQDAHLVALVHVGRASFPAAAPQAVALAVSDGE